MMPSQVENSYSFRSAARTNSVPIHVVITWWYFAQRTIRVPEIRLTWFKWLIRLGRVSFWIRKRQSLMKRHDVSWAIFADLVHISVNRTKRFIFLSSCSECIVIHVAILKVYSVNQFTNMKFFIESHPDLS
jgi:hypothetical protein